MRNKKKPTSEKLTPKDLLTIHHTLTTAANAVNKMQQLDQHLDLRDSLAREVKILKGDFPLRKGVDQYSISFTSTMLGIQNERESVIPTKAAWWKQSLNPIFLQEMTYIVRKHMPHAMWKRLVVGGDPSDHIYHFDTEDIHSSHYCTIFIHPKTGKFKKIPSQLEKHSAPITEEPWARALATLEIILSPSNLIKRKTEPNLTNEKDQ